MSGRSRDDPREWEHYVLIVGACLASERAREQVFAKLSFEDCPYRQLKPVLAALKENDPAKIRLALEGMVHLIGCEFQDGCLAGVIEKVTRSAANRKEIAALEARLKELSKI